jgi:hypothetical protein
LNILQCKVFGSAYANQVENNFNDWCKQNKIGLYDIKDIKYRTDNESYSIFVLYSKEIEPESELSFPTLDVNLKPKPQPHGHYSWDT